ncbi:hypothetical protein EVU94_14880 [Flavobacteriaceae bacterium 144Ye]|nr:hypothetical protein EVU94_14880 [Flavobacteriaceae bacterium 144Ye]
MNFLVIDHKTQKEIAEVNLKHLPRTGEGLLIKSTIFVILTIIHSEEGTIIVVSPKDDKDDYQIY